MIFNRPRVGKEKTYTVTLSGTLGFSDCAVYVDDVRRTTAGTVLNAKKIKIIYKSTASGQNYSKITLNGEVVSTTGTVKKTYQLDLTANCAVNVVRNGSGGMWTFDIAITMPA